MALQLLNDTSTLKAWEKKVHVEAELSRVFFSPLLGLTGPPGSGAAFELCDALEGGGNLVTSTVLRHLGGHGTTGGEPLENQFEALKKDNFQFQIGSCTCPPTIVRDAEDQQHAIWNWRSAYKQGAMTWMGALFEHSVAAQLVGATYNTAPAYHRPNGTSPFYRADYLYSGMNPIVAPTTGHKIGWTAGGTFTNNATGTTLLEPEALTTSHTLVFPDTIHYLENLAQLATPAITPAKTKHGMKYVLFVHRDVLPDSFYATTSEYSKVDHSMLQGGTDYGKTAFSTGEVRMYHDTLIVPTTWMPPGTHSSTSAPVANTRTFAFVGAGALKYAWGRGYKGRNIKWREDDANIKGAWLAVASTVWGCKRVTMTPETAGEPTYDQGVLSGTCYARNVTTL